MLCENYHDTRISKDLSPFSVVGSGPPPPLLLANTVHEIPLQIKSERREVAVIADLAGRTYTDETFILREGREVAMIVVLANGRGGAIFQRQKKGGLRYCSCSVVITSIYVQMNSFSQYLSENVYDKCSF